MSYLFEHERPTRAEIDLDALAFNFHSVRRFIGEGVECMAVVKADAYGHGAAECSRRLEREGAKWFGAATLEEGIELREAGIAGSILIFGGIWPGQETPMISHDLTPAIFTLDQARRLDRAAADVARRVQAHVKIDTGMNRVGFRCEDVPEVADRLSHLANIEITGLMTHFAAADDLGQTDFTERQMARFAGAVQTFHDKGFRPKYIDMANSPGAIVHPLSRSGMVRIGGLLYGLGGDVLPPEAVQPELRPVMAVKSRIAQVRAIKKGETVGYGRTFLAEKDHLIATVAIGYHDGLRRGLSGKGHFLVNGQKTQIAGRVSMDWTTIDVSEIPEAKVGDDVTIIGRDGQEEIRAEDIARLADTISYEITCGIDKRVRRVFTGTLDQN
ncbi:MAG: alanine racemase [Pyrinomonadaceae bacterium]